MRARRSWRRSRLRRPCRTRPVPRTPRFRSRAASPGRTRARPSPERDEQERQLRPLLLRLRGDVVPVRRLRRPTAHAVDRLSGDLDDLTGGLADRGRKSLVDHGLPFDRGPRARVFPMCQAVETTGVSLAAWSARTRSPRRRVGAGDRARGRRSGTGSAVPGCPCAARTRTSGASR